MRKEEEQETQEPVRQKIENVDGASQRNDRAGQEDAARIEMKKMREQKICA